MQIHPVRTSATLCLALLVVGQQAGAQSAAQLSKQRYAVDPMHSSIAFTSTIVGAVKVRGRFNTYDATVIYDSAHPERSSVSAVIQATSINTDMSFRDDHLRSPDFFDVKQFPNIEFTSDRVVPSSGGVTVSGMLTMHGVSRRLTFPAKLVLPPGLDRGTVAHVAFSAELRLSRKDFGIAGTNKFNPDYNPLTDMLSDNVAIQLDLLGEQQTYSGRTLGTGTPPGAADTVNRVLLARGAAAAIEAFRTLRSTPGAGGRARPPGAGRGGRPGRRRGG